MFDADVSTMSKVADFTLKMDAGNVPDSARTIVSWLLLDTIGICAGAVHMDAGRIARDSTVELYGASPEGEGARIMFDGRRVT